MTEIRECTAEDFPEVFKLLPGLWPKKPLDETRLRETYLRALQSPNQAYLAALEGDELVGFCSLSTKQSLWQEGPIGHLDEILVVESARGQGVGSRLLAEAQRLASSLGCRRIELDSAFSRERAHQFYQQNGYENRAYLFSKELA